MVLTDVDIYNALKEKRLIIKPKADKSITPAGYDLRIGEIAIFLNIKGNDAQVKLKRGEIFSFAPGATALIRTEEYIELPKRIVGTIHSSFSFSWKGISHISTTVDPGWKGYLWITLHNYGIVPIDIERGKKFCTLVFHETKSENLKPHGHSMSRDDIVHIARSIKQYEERQKSRDVRINLITLLLPFVVAVSVFFWGQNVMSGKESGIAALAALSSLAVFLVSDFIKNYYLIKNN